MTSLKTYNAKTGLFLAIEGIDGSGKTTVFKMVGDRLNARGITPLLLTHEPTSGAIGKEIYDRLLGTLPMIAPMELQRLCVRDRLAHVQGLIDPVLARGGVVLSDRYWLSTLAHGMMDADLETMLSLHADVFGESLLIPNHVFLLDVPEEVAFERLLTHGKQLDHFEQKSKLAVLRKNYLAVSEEMQKRGYGSVTVINASVPLERMSECADHIWKMVLPSLSLSL